MSSRLSGRIWGRAWAGFGLLAAAFAASLAAANPSVFKASQKGQAFNPAEVSIHVGDAIAIVNDDGDILHHAYIESSTFNFDSGDQEPGSTVSITFPVAGTFNVLCGIHPKMRMRVEVK